MNFNGASLVGYPIPQVGFNETLGWTHTVSAASRFAFYHLQLKDGDPLTYIKDGEERPITSRTFQIEVAEEGGTVMLEKTFYYSEFGPMVAGELANAFFPVWGGPDVFDREGTTALAYRDANAETDVNLYEQWFGMTRSRNIAELESVFETCGTTYWVNTIAADADGNATYIDGSAAPNLSGEAIDALKMRAEANIVVGLALENGLPILDGGTSRDDWVEGECGYGTVPFGEAPTLTRRDFVQNSNDSAWATNPAEFLTDFSPVYGQIEVEQGLRTRIGLEMLLNPTDRGASSVAPAGEDGLFNAVELMELLYSNRTFYGELSGVLEGLLERCDAIGTDPVNLPGDAMRSVAEGCAAIAGWDGLTEVDSTGVHAFRVFIDQYESSLPDDFVVPFDPRDPLGTPRDPIAADDDLSNDPMLRALAAGLELLDLAGLEYDAPLGVVQVVQQSQGVPPGEEAIPQGERIPWHGGRGVYEGAFNAQGVASSSVAQDTRYPRVVPPSTIENTQLSVNPGEGYLISSGTSWHFGLEFTEEGPVAYGLLAYSQSSDSTSPHFRDQDERYSVKDYRKLLYSEADIEADSNLTTKIVTSD